jgi:leucine dehydrogenase
VLVQGAGHVGATLARLLAEDGAEVLIADVDVARAAEVAAAVGGSRVDADDVLHVRCDVFAPCAIARVIDPTTVDRVACRIIAGAANDTLSEPGCAAALAERGVVYVPDFVANAGGVIQIHALASEWDDDRTRAEILTIGDRVRTVLEDAAQAGITPLQAAVALAQRRLAAHQPARG